MCQFWFAFVFFVDIFVPTLLSANRFYILSKIPQVVRRLWAKKVASSTI